MISTTRNLTKEMRLDRMTKLAATMRTRVPESIQAQPERLLMAVLAAYRPAEGTAPTGGDEAAPPPPVEEGTA